MEVSIIIVSWNTKRLILDCVNSIIKSKPKAEYEVIVVDNGSEDNSVQSVKALKIRNLRVIENNDNLGFAKANNQGIKIAKGDYTFLLNSDAKVKNGTIDTLLDFAKGTPDAGVVVPKLLNPDGSAQASIFRCPTLGRAIAQYWFGRKGILDKYVPKKNAAQKVEAAIMAAFLITPKAVKRVGYLDERYFMYFEDIDYCKRVRDKGLKVYFLPQAEVYHLHGASGKKLAPFEDQWRRLVPSSKIYHGQAGHLLFNFILWSGQKWRKIFG